MSDIKQQLDSIKKRISDPDFLANKGLANEVGIHVFCYDPSDELVVRDFIHRITNAQSDEYRIIELNLYNIFLEILSERRILDKIPIIEEKRGRDFLLKDLQSKHATADAFLKKMQYQPVTSKDVLFLTGIGAVHPFIRSHIILNAMQPKFPNTPILVFYPGSYDGKDLSLFNEPIDGNYYRAFNNICEEDR